MRQDGKNFLKCTAVPTLFDVPKKPKTTTVHRVNPLERKWTDAVIDQPVTAAMVSTVKVPRDHIYCKLQRTVGQSTLRFGAGHTYACRDSLQCNV